MLASCTLKSMLLLLIPAKTSLPNLLKDIGETLDGYEKMRKIVERNEGYFGPI